MNLSSNLKLGWIALHEMLTAPFVGFFGRALPRARRPLVVLYQYPSEARSGYRKSAFSSSHPIQFLRNLLPLGANVV